jgi:HlyD family secretion protein
MLNGQKRSRKRWYIATFLGVIAIGAAAGFARLGGSSGEIDPGKFVTAETGTMVRSVVATGKIEPMTKVEIKSKANGIIEALPVDVDSEVKAGAVLAELDKEQLRPAPWAKRIFRRSRGAPGRGGPQKEHRQAEGPTSSCPPELPDAQQLFAQRLISQSQLDDAAAVLTCRRTGSVRRSPSW